MNIKINGVLTLISCSSLVTVSPDITATDSSPNPIRKAWPTPLLAPTAQLALPTAQLALPTAQLALPTAQPALPTAQLALPTAHQSPPTALLPLPTALPPCPTTLKLRPPLFPTGPTPHLLPMEESSTAVYSAIVYRQRSFAFRM
jgi:hypothetical protein